MSALGEFHEVGFDEVVEVAVHHAAHVAGLVVGAVVLDAPVIKDVAAYLASPFDFLLAVLDLALLLASVLELLVVEDGAQVAQGVLAVLGLVACLGVLDQDFLFLAGVGVLILVADAHA